MPAPAAPAGGAAKRTPLRLILDTLPALVGILTPDGRIVDGNRLPLETFGLDLEAIVGRHFADIFPWSAAPAEQQELRDGLDRAARGETVRWDVELPTRTGTLLLVDCWIIPVKDSDGRITQLVAAGVDITERKRAEQALRESEQRYRSLVELAQEAILILEDDLIRYCNPAGVALLGAPSLQALLDRPIGSFFHADDRDWAAERRRQIRETNRPVPPRELRLVRLDGRTIDVESSGAPCVHRGQPAIQVVFRDVTERRRAEESLRASEAKYRAVFENAVEGFFQTTPEGRFLSLNPALARIYGYDSPQEVIARFADIGSELYADPNRRQEFIRLMESRGEVKAFEFEIRRRDGSRAWVSESARAVRDAGGKLLWYEGTVEDITERKHAEEERRRLEAQLQHAQKLESLGVLAGGVAHDFNNLLTSMLGYASLALMQLPEESIARPMLREIEKAALRASELTEQMLAYAGRGTFVIQKVHLDVLVDEMTKLLATVLSKKASLHLHLDPAVVEGDATQIRQVVMNLLTNASDALEDQPGVITVRTSIKQADRDMLRSPFLLDELPPGPYACLEVEDTGCGMSPETVGRIFDPFFTTKFIGRGLGLAAVLGIVKAHRGAIKVDSTPGQGSRFQVLVPCSTTVPTQDDDARKGEAAQLRGQGVVLVVDDEPSVRGFARRALEGAGFEVRQAADGREALKAFAAQPQEIDLVLLDLTMPRMDGTEVLRELRRLRSDVAVLVMSGYSELEVATRCGGLGARGFIQKPFHPRELIARLCELLPKRVS